MTNKNDFHPPLPPRPLLSADAEESLNRAERAMQRAHRRYRPRSRLQRALRWLDASDPFGRMIEWIIVILVIVCLVAVVAIASRNIDGDLDTSAKVIEEQHRRVIEREPTIGGKDGR